MNLAKLFETQKKLDDRIIEEKGLQGQELLDKKILALQVELGELANEWRGFKFWSEDQEPRTTSACNNCNGKGGWSNEGGFHPCETCWGTGEHGNPLLEEYVDVLHLALSIGNEDKSYSDFDVLVIMKSENVVKQFSELFKRISEFDNDRNWMTYKDALSTLRGLGEMLGFTDEQIEQSYYEKNRINHERQQNAY